MKGHPLENVNDSGKTPTAKDPAPRRADMPNTETKADMVQRLKEVLSECPKLSIARGSE